VLLENTNRQQKMETVMIENLAPKEHLFRKIDKYINFSFVNEICRPYYCEDNGSPAIESVRHTKRKPPAAEVQVNVAYRWFLG
jgi:hypothetical protein